MFIAKGDQKLNSAGLCHLLPASWKSRPLLTVQSMSQLLSLCASTSLSSTDISHSTQLQLTIPLSPHSPVDGNGQQGIGGDVERDSAQVVDRGAQDVAMLPGELAHHVVVHFKGAADNGYQEIRDGQVGNEQVGEVAQLLVAGQGDDEDEVADAADQHDAHQGHANDNLGRKESSGIGHILIFIQGHVIITIAEVEWEGSSLGSMGVKHRKEVGGDVGGVLIHVPRDDFHLVRWWCLEQHC